MQLKRLVKQCFLNGFIKPLRCDVTLQVSDIAMVSLLHGNLEPDARCTSPFTLRPCEKHDLCQRYTFHHIINVRGVTLSSP